MVYSFEKFEVWQKSRKLTKKIYEITSDYPSEERFGLISQLRRAAISLGSNIAEGSARWSDKEKARFYEISFGSLIEILNQLILSNDLGFLSSEKLIETRKDVEQITRMLTALHKAVKP